MCLSMASADFCWCIHSPSDECSFGVEAHQQISPGNAHLPSRLYLPYIRLHVLYRYRTLRKIALSSHAAASYAVPVRQVSVLPAASFGFCLTTDTLAVRLTLPPVGCVKNFPALGLRRSHLQAVAPCRAQDKKGDPDFLESPFCL